MKMLAYKFHGAPTAETKKQAWRNTPRQQQTARRLTQRYIYKHLSFYFYFSVERLAKKMEKIESNNLVSPVVTRRPSLVFFFCFSLHGSGRGIEGEMAGTGWKKTNKNTLSCPCLEPIVYFFLFLVCIGWHFLFVFQIHTLFLALLSPGLLSAIVHLSIVSVNRIISRLPPNVYI